MLKPENYTSSYLPTATDVRYLTNCDERSILQGNRIPSWAVELFHDDGTRAPLLLDDGTNDASQYFVDGSITWNATADCQYQCQMVFTGELADQFSTETAIARIFDCEWDRADNQVLKVPRGYFRFSVPQRDLITEAGDSLLTVQGYDLTYRLQKVLSLHDLVVPSGINIKTAMVALLRQDDHEASEGGRAASGTPIPGTPQAGLPVYTGAPYTSVGISTSVFSIDPTNGYLKSPSGIYGFVFYNPYDGAYCDATTYAPIDPWTKAPMQPFPSFPTPVATVIWYTSQTGIVFHSNEGQFYRLTSGNVLDMNYIINPETLQPLPSGLSYKRPDVANPPSGFLGTLPPPLSTWPYSYDHSGPYLDGGGATSTTTTTTSLGPKAVAFPLNALMAQRQGYSTTAIMPVAAYAPVNGTSTPDPAHPGQVIIEGVIASGQKQEGPDVSGWVFPSGEWTVGVTVIGSGFMAGSFTLVADVYEHTAGGAYILRGSLGLGGLPSEFSETVPSETIAPSVTGFVTGFTAASGSHLAFALQLLAEPPITALLAQTGPTQIGSVSTQIATVAWVSNPTVPGGTSFVDTSGGSAGATTPVLSGSTIPWPQTTYPALASSGCAVLGPNWPADLIDIPDTDAVTLAPMTWSGTTTLWEFLNQLGALAQFQPLGINLETGAIETQYQPYTQNADLPTIEKTYSNELPQTDGLLCSPVSQKLVDELADANVIVVTASSNSNGVELVAVIKNDQVDSPISSVNLHRREIKKIQADELQTQDQVNERALLEALLASEGTWAVDIQVPRDPFHARYDTINVVFVTDDGRYLLNGRDNPYICTAWTEEAWNPLMRLTCTQTTSWGGSDPNPLPLLASEAMRIGSPLGGHL